ncbi:MAG: DUF4403 family protein [Tsuneonella suprasediminis]|uniref:DUF4403 family protein n=1 Tax=Tsuneonella suprasediminis TaxID=2306996 RepID=A0A419R4I3_9SPHN|nr:DUF4403 family protein [Tsuneonella suprasediminis]RJX69861.1 DUF4403 family protein [Tsuneonella suprasediminis]UBS31861.1 DUF4403 family protein [Altererythrobacter sp. N1]
MANGWVHRLAMALCGTMALAGCKQSSEPFAPPPRANDAIEVPDENSVIAVPVKADLSKLVDNVAREIPRTLYQIDRKDQTCLASKKVKVAFVKLKTPKIKCDIVGTVTRGKMAIAGRGRDIVVTMPIHAEVHAKDIAGILKQETATADANVRAVIRLSIDRQWNPRGKIAIRYDWTDTPHIDFLGQRIEFTKDADKELKSVIAKLERSLPRELEKVHLRRDIERLWGEAFTVLQLNEKNPPVWMRIEPQQLQYGGYSLSGKTLNLKLGMTARTQTFVGDKPAPPDKKPLPPRTPLSETPGKLAFFIPVVADYAELEPVIARALNKRAARPFKVPGIGPVQARFGKIEVYGSTGGRVAVGATFTAQRTDGKYGAANGTVWLTGVPHNQPNSRKVSFSDVSVTGDSDRMETDILMRLASAPGYQQAIADALTQNFEGDFDDLKGKIERAIARRREGDLVIHARIDEVNTGELKAAGRGLYLPVQGSATTSITLTAR